VGPEGGPQTAAKATPSAAVSDSAPREIAATKEEAPDPSGGYTKVGDLYYLEIVTGGADPEAELPMVVAIHGLGDEPRNFAGVVADLPVPARVILPRAIDDYEVGWSWFPVRAADPDVDALAEGIARAAAVVDTGIEKLERERPTSGKPVVVGFSQGGMLTFALAVNHPDRYAAAVPVGGWLPPPLWPDDGADVTKVPPIVALHGDADPAVKIQPTRDAVARLATLGIDAQLHEYADIRHAIPPQMRAELHALIVASLAQ